ncbi:hypothetical protein BUALT_Bualt15G0027800 [Buddleja alternifolia]|uniref:Cytochrome P450 n=1 Tax=Buddleja alternifolia TaxID=168488 RepID=A0AAV6WHF0_9LAMI|nr:hypothetical protein BUALT_Bualt15G0027800 [Buddleja alternifolia]
MYGAFGANKLYGAGHDLEGSQELIKKFTNVTRSQMSFPLNIPGTQYHNGLKDKERVLKIIRDIVHSRVASPLQNNINEDDMLSKMIKDMKSVDFLTEEFITQLLFGLSYTVFSSVPTVLGFAMKFISENPAVLRELIVEHEEILKKKENLDSSITWEECYTIPKGWGVMVCQSVMHLDPNLYKDPATFNPWRWKDVKPEFISKYLTPFGGGMKQCAGIPLIGESLELIIPNYSFDVQPFIKKRLQRYGPLFRTNVAGRNVVVSTDREFNDFLFQQEEKLVVHWYLDSFAKLFKQEGKLRPDGLLIHKYTRNLSLSHFGVECIKQKLLSQFEQLVHKTLQSWSTRGSIDVKSAFVTMYGEFGANLLYSYDSESSKALTDKFINVSKAAMSFPLNIPGTTYHKCLKDKEKVLKLINDVVKRRLSSQQDDIQDDMLSQMIKDMKSVDFLTEEFITQLLFGLSFATFETIPSVLAEHEEILKQREIMDSSVTWEEYKSMKFTLQVINETLRLGNTIPGFLRKAVKDIHVNGYTIPEGWGIMVCHSTMHLDPNTYEDPLKFNPWRWKDVTPEVMYKNLKPFGGGIKQCAGADYARASMSIVLHVLVTKYRWTVLKGGDIIQNPILHFKNGLHINLSERPN